MWASSRFCDPMSSSRDGGWNSSRSPWPAEMEGGGAIVKYAAHQNWLFHEVLE